MTSDFSADLAAVAMIDSVPTILEVVCRTTKMGFAAVARVTEDRWIACGVRDEIAFGLQPGGELQIETTICHEIQESRQPVVISDVATSPLYRNHRTPALYGLRSYISMPIVLPDGRFFGTLCAIDRAPRELDDPATIGMFKLFAELIAFHLDAHQRVASAEARLAGEMQTGETREQFIAVLGHDLRNPLASIEAGTRLVLKTGVNDKARVILDTMRQSVGRMSGLIDDVLDFARGRLGGGFSLERASGDLGPALAQVVEELRLSHLDRTIESQIGAIGTVDCDSERIAQLLSNLLANALVHGAPDTPIAVTAGKAEGVFEMTVANQGAPIPPAVLQELFKPFVRASAKPNQQGLGLGLYIAAEIARAHAGTLDVTSDDGGTRFRFRMPA